MTRLHDDDNTRDAEMHRSSFSTTAVEPFGAGVKSTSDMIHDWLSAATISRTDLSVSACRRDIFKFS